MSKRVQLTYKHHKTGEVLVEETLLVSDDDSVFGGGVVLGLTVSDISDGYVMFEDEFGLFGIDPKNVIQIKPLE